jgi:hypothetical protein
MSDKATYDAYIQEVIEHHRLPRMNEAQLITWSNAIAHHQGAFWDEVRVKIGKALEALASVDAQNTDFSFAGVTNMKLVAALGGIMMGVRWFVAVYQITKLDGSYEYIEERTIAGEATQITHTTREAAYTSAKAFSDAMKGTEQAQ